MADWPTTLPWPSSHSCTFGENALYRAAQSGRREVTRYGSGAPDRWKITLRLFTAHPEHGDQVEAFKAFHRGALCLGVNWFTAPWVGAMLGYSDHKCKVLGYPSFDVATTFYSDISFDLLIKKSSSCPADQSWPPVGG